jgi:hypothetical protein
LIAKRNKQADKLMMKSRKRGMRMECEKRGEQHKKDLKKFTNFSFLPRS